MNLNDKDIPLINEANNKPGKNNKSVVKDTQIKEKQIYTPEIKETKPKEAKIRDVKSESSEAVSKDIKRLMEEYANKNSDVIPPDSQADTDNSIDAISSKFDDMLDFNSHVLNEATVDDIGGRLEDILDKTKLENKKDSNDSNEGFIEEIIDKSTVSSGKRKKKKKKLAYNIIMTALVCVFVGCAAYLINYFITTKKSEDKYDALRDLIIADDGNQEASTTEYVPVVDNDGNVDPPKIVEEPTFVEVDGRMVLRKYSELYRRNHDFYGWLTIGDTVVNYPVMYTPEDQDYYLHRDFDKDYSDPGTLFIDISCDVETPGDNLIIYGHNMLSGKMFASLLDYESEEYYRKYKYIQFNTIDGEGVYEVIAAFRSKIQKPDYTGFRYYKFFGSSNEEEFNDYVYNCRINTPYNTSDAEYGDQLITLSTCAYHAKDGRFVVVAKKVE